MNRSSLIHFITCVVSAICMASCGPGATPRDNDDPGPVTDPGTNPLSDINIVADHTAVDRYTAIPDSYLAIVKTWLVDIAGESHSKGYRTGMTLLGQQKPRYAVAIFDGGTMPAVTNLHLRLGRHGSTGEEDFFTNNTGIAAIKSKIRNQHESSNPIHVLGFGWCWDMTADHGPSATRDTVYNVSWYGRINLDPSQSGTSGPWGLDSADSAITGQSVCMDSYLGAVNGYNTYCHDNDYSCVVIFTTGPVDGSAEREAGYQREVKHDYIRQYVKNHGGILFDYADILCWNNGGVKYTSTWDDSGTSRTYAQIHPDNMMDYDASWNTVAHTEDGDHIGEVGTVRLAKAMWWLLARMAGWDGN